MTAEDRLKVRIGELVMTLAFYETRIEVLTAALEAAGVPLPMMPIPPQPNTVQP